MIYQKLCDQLTQSAKTLWHDVLLTPCLLHDKKRSLMPLYGVTPQDIKSVSQLRDIKILEEQFSPRFPYYTIMPITEADTALSQNWIAINGGTQVQEMAMQELSAGRIGHHDETLLIQIVEKMPADQCLLIRNI